MNGKVFLTVFGTVFLAELGDKTQLATMLFAADRQTSRITVFTAASLALICTSALGVLAGSLLSRYVEVRELAILAGIAFIAIGLWTITKAW
ncbi:MAG: TMEM165/GDT1 family protein [Xanthomonadaceae bacterium]|nr:TMEM165/GDT1 family protein [Xanthomonadaceae bacterium]